MTRGLREIFAVGLLAMPLVASCGDDKAKITAPIPCHINSDCKDPLVCGLNTCHTACDSTRDCNETLGEHCLVTSGDDHVCASPDDQKCTYNSDCKTKDPLLICARDLHCRSECQTKDDCAKSQICVKPDLLCADQSELMDGMLADLHGPGRDGKDGDPPSGGGTANTPGEGGAGNTPGDGGNTTGGVSTGGKSGHPTGGSVGLGGASTADAGAAGATASKCQFGTGDCDDNPDDCETDLTLSPNCGACNVVCKSNHGPVLCDPDLLKCVVNAQIGCDPGYADCNHDGKDGCESLSATDADNCGMCGHTCGGGKCAAGVCSAPIFFDPNKAPTAGVTYNASGDTFLIGGSFVKLNVNDSTEFRVAPLPTSPATLGGSLLVSSTVPIYSASVDATNLYYTIGGSPSSVLYKPLSGSAATPAKTAATLPNGDFPYTITATASSLYIYTSHGSGTGAIFVADKNGTAAAAQGVPGLTDLGGYVYSPILVAGGNLFWALSGNIAVDLFTAPSGGGMPVKIAHLVDSGGVGFLLADDGKYVYWITVQGTGSKVQRVLAKGSPTADKVEDVAVGINQPAQAIVLVDDMYVYYLEGFQVYRVQKDGLTSPEPLANVTQAPNIYNLFAVDDKFVYGTGSGGQIVGVQKDALSQ